MVISITALNATAVPVVAAAAVATVASNASTGVPAVPNLNAKVETLAAVDVVVPDRVTLMTVPATNLFAGKGAVCVTCRFRCVKLQQMPLLLMLPPLNLQGKR